MEFKPLGGVGGIPPDLGPYEGVPAHLRSPIVLWVQSILWLPGGFETDLALQALATLRLALPGDEFAERADVPAAVWQLIRSDDELLLQLVHLLAYRQAAYLEASNDFDGRTVENISRLESLLVAGGSVWTVALDSSGLARRVDATTRAQFDEMVSPGDAASAELAEAWANVYSFSPNPSDAWDHCIKALEALLKPIVMANKPEATLGDVVGELRANRSTRGFKLRDNGLKNVTDPQDTLVGLLRLVWPNADRHQGSLTREPSVQEVRGVLAATLAVAQWAREGLIH